MLIFPPQDNLTIDFQTNVVLSKNNTPLTTRGEALRFIGVCISATQHEFDSRRDL